MYDLWPDDVKGLRLRTPETVLREQASLLKNKTNGIVLAGVSEVEISNENAEFLIYHFFIIAPRLEDYRFRLFAASYNMDLYPVIFELDEELREELKEQLGEWKEPLTAESEQQLESILREIFHSKKTRLVIGSLLTQSEPPFSQ